MIKECRICRSKKLELILDLGHQPWCNDFVTKEQIGQEKTYPLRVCFCCECSTVQVDHTVPKDIMYSNHLYLSGVNRTMFDHFQSVSDKVCSDYIKSEGLVVDIGSNDGTLLSTYRKYNMDLLGVEPCNIPAQIAIDNDISTDIEFFNYEYAEDLLKKRGNAQVISAANVFYHVEELHSIVKGIKHLLADDGVFVMQGSYLPSLVKNRAFDIMYHEHLLYYRVETLGYLLNLYGLEIIDIDEAPVHGGSIIAYVGHKGSRTVKQKVLDYKKQEKNDGFHKIEKYQEFSSEVVKLRSDIRSLVQDLSENNTIFAFGAPAKGTVLLNYCGFTDKEISCAVEKNHLKIGRYIPCTGIPIVDEDAVEEPDYYLVLSWNFLESFCKSDAYLSGKRKFIVPVPEPMVLSNGLI